MLLHKILKHNFLISRQPERIIQLNQQKAEGRSGLYLMLVLLGQLLGIVFLVLLRYILLLAALEYTAETVVNHLHIFLNVMFSVIFFFVCSYSLKIKFTLFKVISFLYSLENGIWVLKPKMDKF